MNNISEGYLVSKKINIYIYTPCILVFSQRRADYYFLGSLSMFWRFFEFHVWNLKWKEWESEKGN